jgi:hypothetical protein
MNKQCPCGGNLDTEMKSMHKVLRNYSKGLISTLEVTPELALIMKEHAHDHESICAFRDATYDWVMRTFSEIYRGQR